MSGTLVPEPPRSTAAVLAEAAESAGRAPSIHNTQPWRWLVTRDALDLYADRTRALPDTDPDGRMLIISCAAALHHARVALAAEGFAAQVRLLPSADDPDHLARVTITGSRPVTPEAMLLMQATEVRHTDRRPTTAVDVTADQIDDLRRTATAEGVDLHRLNDDQVTELVIAVSRAEDIAATDPVLREETARWTGPDRPEGTGLPPEVIPASRPQTDVGERDFGSPGTLRIGGEHDKHAAYVVLFSAGDDPEAWLRAGQAMSAVWLRATELGLTVLPFSQVVEIDATRLLLYRMLAELGHAHLVMRVGVADPDHAGPPHTPRLPFEQTVQVSDEAGVPRPGV